MDLLIATAALVENVALLTANQKHFEAVPDLRLLSYR
jgi:predicted nucleic acid-binding protein